MQENRKVSPLLASRGRGPYTMVVLIRGGGDLATGVAWRLYQSGFRVIITETHRPLAVRRMVSFCEAVFEGRMTVEGVTAVLVPQASVAKAAWTRGEVPVLVDPECSARIEINPDVLVDAIMAKRNLGTSIDDAPLVIALGPGFEAGRDAHFVVETKRGHYLGRLLSRGPAEADTGIPGPVLGITKDRVLRAPADGLWKSDREIGESVKKGDFIGEAGGMPVTAKIDGVLRGLIRPGVQVREGLKIGDIDPRGVKEHCFTISEKALAVAGGVLEGILRHYSS